MKLYRIDLKDVKRVLRLKECLKCKIQYFRLPESARLFWANDPFDGIYFECKCGTTIWLPRSKIESKAA